MLKKSHPRRKFLKNTSLAGIGLLAAPTVKILASPPSSECEPTTQDFFGQGPFYTEGAPELNDGLLVPENDAGQRLILSGRVYNSDCSGYIPNALIDVWHADAEGNYDNEGFRFRGKVYSNEQGFYLFETVYPGKYLNGTAFRPSHIHVKITPPGFPTLTTQIYFAGDTDLETDSASSITSGQFDARARIISLEENSEGKLEGTWDIALDGDGIINSADLHLDKGMIYGASPNPFKDEVTIQYGIFNEAPGSLEVYDVKGQLIANLTRELLKADKYEAVWQTPSGLSAGHYFIVLKINELQVHYLKILKER